VNERFLMVNQSVSMEVLFLDLSQNPFRFRAQAIILRDEVDDEIFEHSRQLVVRHQPYANFWFVEFLDDRTAIPNLVANGYPDDAST
jgi:UDP-3-O-[3-hydroxymyristoyl] glucosamine N-acyltransferase